MALPPALINLINPGFHEMMSLKIPKRMDNLFRIVPGTAAMIIGSKHPLKGETGYVLSVDRSESIELAELRMDRTGEIKFVPARRSTPVQERDQETARALRVRVVVLPPQPVTSMLWTPSFSRVVSCAISKV